MLDALDVAAVPTEVFRKDVFNAVPCPQELLHELARTGTGEPSKNSVVYEDRPVARRPMVERRTLVETLPQQAGRVETSPKYGAVVS
ncbi:unnamed protein product [Toxocara canis]|uniref:DUF5753 domain-containing protein n=1 Tax=Toxocara canis TaxID=6265 RepID=A0A183UIN5_TOXCA|nr:unnamed protein product [Toxocara canis]